MRSNVWYDAAQTINSVGMIPFPVNETLIELLQLIMSDEQAAFVRIFDKPSQTMEQLKEKSELSEDALLEMLESLMLGGIVVGTTSRRTGVMVYRLLPLFPGIFEYTNLRGEVSDRHRRIVQLLESLLESVVDFTQENYDDIMTFARKMPPVPRVVPIEAQIGEHVGEKVMPAEEVSCIVDQFDEIALVNCYCRHGKDLLGDPCKVTDNKSNCFLLGKSAQFASKYEFGQLISKEEAKEILVGAADDGLVHKAFHIHLDTTLEEEAICSCCKCCCGIFQMYYKGALPYHCYTKFQAIVDENRCSLCGACVEACPMEATFLTEEASAINVEQCIGCGVCAHQCPEDAIKMRRGETREVFVPPSRRDPDRFQVL